MSEQWGTLTTEGVGFEEFCRGLLSIPAAQDCQSAHELADLLVDVHVSPGEDDRIDATAHDWARSAPENIRLAFDALRTSNPSAHVRAYHCDTRGYEIERTYTHTPDVGRGSARFGELRSILAHGASKETFDALCDSLGRSRPSPEAIDYLRGHVSSWPRDVPRVAPPSWLWHKTQWGTCPQLELCDRVEFPSRRPEYDAARVHHLSIRTFGVSAPTVYAELLSGETDATSVSDFTSRHQGLRIHSPRDGETFCTYTHTYDWSARLEFHQRVFPTHLFHLYACNIYGDYAYMRLYEGPTLLYEEDLRSQLPLEARVFSAFGEELAFEVASGPGPGAYARLRELGSRLDELGIDPGDVLTLSGVTSWFEGNAPAPKGPKSARDADILRCLRNTREPRYMPTSREELVDPLDNDDIPF